MATSLLATSPPFNPIGKIGHKYKARWQQTMIRIKDPSISIPFYERHFGMTLIHSYTFTEMKFSVYFMERVRDGQHVPPRCTAESENYLWNMQGTTLELTHNHGSEDDDSFTINNGNEEPFRGFGHIAFNTNDVYTACDKLQTNGVKFQKKPDEGRMKGLAFVLDPDGYWIEIVGRNGSSIIEEFNLSQTMIRVKNIKKSLEFYTSFMGMVIVRESLFEDFSLYFLASLSDGDKDSICDPKSPESRAYCKNLWQPVLELTYNHGYDENPDFSYHNGNDTPQGFGHIGFLVDDLDKCSQELEEQGIIFRKKPTDGKMQGIAFVYDPDGYSVELIQRGVKFPQAK